MRKTEKRGIFLQLYLNPLTEAFESTASNYLPSDYSKITVSFTRQFLLLLSNIRGSRSHTFDDPKVTDSFTKIKY